MYIKLKIIFSVSLLATLFYGYNFNPPNGKTGAPFDRLCTECHQGTNTKYSGALSLTGLPDKVKLGETYPLELKMTLSNGNPKRAGFQMVSAGGTEFKNAGTFMSLEEKVDVFSKKDRNYVEHHGAKNFNEADSVSWKFNWTVVDSLDADSIEFFAASVLGNGAESSGDRVIKGHFVVAIDQPTATRQIDFDHWKIYPNPMINLLNIETDIHDFQGKIIDMNGNINLEFHNQNKIDISGLPKGMYFLKINNEIQRFIKI